MRFVKNVRMCCISDWFSKQKIISFLKSPGVGFILNIFLKFPKFHPRYILIKRKECTLVLQYVFAREVILSILSRFMLIFLYSRCGKLDNLVTSSLLSFITERRNN